MIELNAATLASGGMVERLNEELQKAVVNCLDVNTEATRLRTVTLKIKIKPDKSRCFGEVSVETSSTLCPAAPLATSISMSTNLKTGVDINSNPKGLMTRHAAVAAYSGPTCTYYGDEIGDKSGKATGNGNPDNWARTSGRISGFNANEQMVHDYVAKVFKARSENPALWRGTAERRTQGTTEIITKTDSQTGNKVMVIFSSTDSNISIGGTGIDLINGGNVSSTVSVKAWVPAFIKMN